MKNPTKKQFTITFHGDRPRLKTQPNSRTRPHYNHHNSQNNYMNQQHINVNKDNLTLPTLYKFSTDHARAKTYQKYDDTPEEIKFVDRRKTIENHKQKQQQRSKEQTQSDKILNQFLINYFKKKNKFALKARASKLKRQQNHTYQPEFLRQTHKNRKQKSPDRVPLVTNSIDAYFNVNNLIQ